MIVRIFEMGEEKTLGINEHTLLIPELKRLIDTHKKDPIPVLRYVYLMTVPDSPYANMEEDEKETMILEDTGGDFTLDDADIKAAIEKLTKLYETPTTRTYRAMKIRMDKMDEYLADAAVLEGRDGNLPEIRQYMQNIGKIHDNYKKLEAAVQEEVKVAMRGKAKQGMY